MTGFDWDDLRYFLAVARCGQLSAAARALRSSHVTVARRLDRLERSLGARLFERSARGHTPTALGERLLRHAETMEGEARSLDEAVADARIAPRGVVRLSAPEGFGNVFLARSLPRLAERHPSLLLEFVTIQQIVSLSRREADIQVTLHPPASGPWRGERIAGYRLFVYASRRYLAAHPPIRDRSDLKGRPLVGYVDEMIFTPGLDYLKDILPGIRASYQSSSIQAQLAAGLAGYGLCIVPFFLARDHPDLVPVLPRELHIERDYWLSFHEGMAETARIRTVADFVREEARRFAPVFAGESLLRGPAKDERA